MSHHDLRNHNISISLSDKEYEKFVALHEESGLRKSAFVRQMLTEGSVTSPLKKEEQEAINQLSKTARDLHRLLGAIYKENLTNHIKWAEKTLYDFEETFKALKEKNNL